MDLMMDIMGKPLWMWLAFGGVVIFLLALDLGVLHRNSKEMTVRESLWMSGFYIAIAAAFGGWVWHTLGAESGKQYFTGYLVEKTLSIDNIFVMSLIFAYFAIPQQYQYRVLFWGILGVIVMRGVMIALGASIVAEFHWVLYIFAVFLVYTGVKMLFSVDEEMDVASNPILNLLRRCIKISPNLHGNKFLAKEVDLETGKKVTIATPLLVALLMIEFVDLIFAVDSIPAIFAITTDPYLVYTSNIFAILGLRALYFALAAVIDRFHYLQHAMAIVLVFIGSKIFICDLMDWDKFPASASLGITLGILTAGIALSLYKTRKI